MMKKAFPASVVPRLAVVGVFALAAWLFNPGMAHAAVAQFVQAGTVANVANGTQVVAISGVDPAKSLLIFETRQNSNRPVGSEVRGRIPIACANPCTTIEFVRVTNEGAPATIDIQWYVVTFASGVRVQRGETLQDSLNKNVTIPLTLAAVNQAFVLWSKTPDAADTSWGTNDFVLGEITSTTNLQFRTNEVAPTHSITWQIVEFTNAADINVQKGTLATMSGATTSVTAALSPPVDVNKTFLLVGLRHTVPVSPNDVHIGAHMIRAQLTDSTTITIDRSTAGTPNESITEILWQAIELKDKSTVVNGSSSFAAGVAQATVPMAPQVNFSRAIAFGSVQNGGGQNLGRSPYVGDDIVGVGAATMALSATQLTLDRNNTVDAADVGWSVVEFEQADAQVVTGSYMGDGTAGRAINALGFVPDLVIVTGANAVSGVFRTSTMTGDNSKLAIGGVALAANHIQSLDSAGGGGFTVGSSAQVNASGVMYYWTAFSEGPGKMKIGSYTGNGLPGRAINGLGFSPEAMFVMAANTGNPVFRTSGHANAFLFSADAGAATIVTSLAADGFTLGTDATVNAAGVIYHYVTWNEVAGEMKVGTYAGDAVDNRSITGVGFTPELVFVKNVGAQPAVQHPASLGSAIDSTLYFQGTVPATNRIQALQTDGFEIGSNNEVNQNTALHLYLAWKHSSQPLILTGDYGGTGVAQSITSVGFAPDVVIVKQATGTQRIAVIRTSTMTDGKPMTGATGLTAGTITSLDASGFTLGTSLLVNSGNSCPSTCPQHYFIAFKAAASAMKVGRYQGTSSASNPITGVGFSPELVFIMSEGGHEPVHYSSANTAAFHDFGTGGTAAAGVIALGADGFTVGTAHTSVNRTGFWYNYIAWNEIPGEMKVGSYVGNATDNRNITGVGFEPEYVIVKEVNNEPAVHHPASAGRNVDSSLFFTATASAADRIQALQPDGFQVGLNNDVNEVDTFVYYAWKRPPPGALTLTAVRLTAFDATRYDRGVLLEWRTGYEISNLGFHVYREVGGERTRVTRSMVAGSGLMAGRGAGTGGERRYAMWDTEGPVDASAVYWLEDRDFNGTSRWHGPLTPVAGGVAAPPSVPASGALKDLGKGEGQRRRKVILERAERMEPPTKAIAQAAVVSAAEMRQAPVQASASTALVIAAQVAVKIGIDRTGWYRITQPELVAAGLEPHANASTLRLFVDGVEQAMMVTGEADGWFDSADAIEFYGTEVDTPYTDTRAYWLVADSQPGLRVTVQAPGSPASAIDAVSFDFTLQQKDRSLYFAGLRNGDQENWFGALVSEVEPTDLVLELSNVDASTGGAAELEIALQGVTDDPAADPDHVVGIVVNGTEVGELSFDGQALGVQSFAIASGLTEGANTVTLVARGGETDISLVDLVRVRYAHAYLADADQLRFTVDGPGTITVGGFTSGDIRVIDITDPLAAEELAGAVDRPKVDLPERDETVAPWTVTVGVPGGGSRTLIAFTGATTGAPAFVRANRPSSWHAAESAADYLAVFHAEFADAVAPLLERREQQGLSTARVDIEDVYDEFSFGEKTPQALRDFIRHALTHWTLAPRFVLLVGDATLDPRDYAGFGDADLVPTKLVPLDDVVLETASDDWFVDVDDDGLPNLAIGRLPVRTPEQLKGIVEKTLGYEVEADAPWMNEVLFVADHDEAEASKPFEAVSQRLKALLPPEYISHELFSSQLDADVLRELLASQVADGRLIVNYTGHGSTQLWGFNGNLLGPDDVNGWTNSRLPFVVAMNCLNGLFQGIYDEESLAETMLRAPRGGAVAVWASSGVTDNAMQDVVAQELYRLIFEGSGATLGELVAAAKLAISDRDVRQSWIFFGDPALRLKGISPAAAPVAAPPQSPPVFRVAVAPDPEADGTDEPEEKPDVTSDDPAVAVVRLDDFTGDGRDDLFLYDAERGAWTVVFSDTGDLGDATGQWGPGLQVMAARLNGDAAADLVFYRPGTGEWAETVNAGPGLFIVRASGTGAPDQQLLLADLTGDGRDDRLMYDPRTGSVGVTTHDPTGDLTEADRAWPAGARLHAGDFNGDGLADLAGYDARTGGGFLALRTSTDFVLVETQWGTGWTVTPARLSDPRLSDLVFYDPQTGAARLALSDGRGGLTYKAGAWPEGLSVQTADLEGDGRDDLFGYNPRSGVWWTAAFSSDGVSESKGEWTPGWQAATGDLDGDGRTDVLLYDPLSGLGFRFHTVTPGLFEFHPETWTPGAVFVGRP